jgi:hypothetical protein
MRVSPRELSGRLRRERAVALMLTVEVEKTQKKCRKCGGDRFTAALASIVVCSTAERIAMSE